MKYPTYAEYQETEADWLGKIPAHWDVKPFWTLYKRLKRTGYENMQLLSVYRDYGVVPKSSRDDNSNKESEDLSGYQLVKSRDLALNKMKAWQGSLGISTYEGIVSPAYFVFEARHQYFDRYLHYLMRSPRYVTGYLSLSKGIRVNQWDLDPQYHSRMPIILPSLEEQTQIANFLDRETAKIDTLIEKQQQLIKLLEEKRQAVISHAVIEGLNPDVKMKDSGVEWLGEVPEHWKVVQVKRLAKMTGGYAFKSEDFCDEGVQLLRIGNVYKNNLSLQRQPVFLPHSYISEYPEFVVEDGNLLMSLTGTLGKRDYGFAVKVSSNRKFLLNQRVGKIIANNNKISSGFLVNCLHSDSYLNQLYSLPFGTKQANLSNENVLEAYICYPPSLDEQKAISSHISEATNTYHRLISKAELMISLAQERRTALISAAVTGKIDVRNVV